MSQDNKQTQRSGVKTLHQKNDSYILQKSKKMINKLHEQQKRNSMTYRSYQNSANKKIRKSSSIQINQSINVLRQRSHSQKSKTSLIQNRLHYLKVSTSRQEQLTSLAKSKYLKVNQIRNQSFTQKNILAKQRGLVLFQHSKLIKEKVNRIRSQKCLSQISQKEMSMKNKREAEGVRKQKKMNQYIIKSRKQQQQKRKRQNAQRMHRSLIISSQKLKNLSRNKVQAGVQNHKRQVYLQFQNANIQKNLNQRLIKKFKTQAKQIFDQRANRQKQLQQYQKYLGLSIGVKRIQKFSSVRAQKVKSQTPIQSSKNSVMEMSKNSKKVQQKQQAHQTKNNVHENKNRSQFYLTNPQNLN